MTNSRIVVDLLTDFCNDAWKRAFNDAPYKRGAYNRYCTIAQMLLKVKTEHILRLNRVERRLDRK